MEVFDDFEKVTRHIERFLRIYRISLFCIWIGIPKGGGRGNAGW